MSEGEWRMTSDVVAVERGIFSRQQRQLDLARHAKVCLELRILGCQLRSGEPQPIAFLFEGILHLLYHSEIPVDAENSNHGTGSIF